LYQRFHDDCCKLIGVLSNAFNLMDVSSYYQMIAKGAVILLAVLADMRGKSAS